MSNVLKMLSRGGAAAAETDPNFNQTVLLLHGDGTNGAQNNTFLDSSSNNFTITRNGNTTQGTFSPFSVAAGEWSNWFNGSTGYLTSPNNAAIQLDNSTAFTIECWFYANSMSTTQAICRRITAGSPFNGYAIVLGENGEPATTLQFWDGSAFRTIKTGLSPNQWYHIAVSFEGSGTTLRFFVNGTQEGSALTVPSGISNTSLVLGIGANQVGAQLFNGYISNFRIVKGTAVYTSSFTPSTTPLTNITNTSLLTCQSNRFVDNSTNAFAITRNGDVRVTPFSPFAPSAAYSAGTNGGSGYFDGTGDFLSIADNAAFELSNSNFAIEAWVYPLALPSSGAIANIASQYITTGSRSFLFALYNNSGTMQLLFQPVSGSTDTAISQNFAFKVGEWAHVAAVRSGNNITLYGNGVSLGTTAYSSTINNATGPYLVGCRYNASSAAELLFTGYIAGHRLIVGSDTAPSGIPTTPPTDVTNTKLLLNFTNAGIIDNTGKNVLETVGNAQIDTAVKKYGTGSLEFDGTGDYLIGAGNSTELQFGTGNFTVEFWVYPNVVNTTQYLIDFRDPASATSAGFQWFIENTAKIGLYVGNTAVIAASTGSISASTWTHLALVKNGSTWTIYINGTADATTGTNTTSLTQGFLTVGTSSGNRNTTTTAKLNGFIDDLRITKGVARYTANFTAPTKEFPDL